MDSTSLKRKLNSSLQKQSYIIKQMSVLFIALRNQTQKESLNSSSIKTLNKKTLILFLLMSLCYLAMENTIKR